MNINDMHILFRLLGQQMGLQEVRGILPESIDLFINDAIIEKVRSVIITNSNEVFQDKLSKQDNLISPINSLRTIYKSKIIPIYNVEKNKHVNVEMNLDNVMIYTSFSVKYQDDNKYFNCRIIDGDKIEETLRDYCNTASWEFPIVSMFYNDKEYISLYTNSKSKIPETLKVNYIELPKRVKLDSDINKCVNCNLPSYLHNEIVQIAVKKFFESINATSNINNTK